MCISTFIATFPSYRAIISENYALVPSKQCPPSISINTKYAKEASNCPPFSLVKVFWMPIAAMHLAPMPKVSMSSDWVSCT